MIAKLTFSFFLKMADNVTFQWKDTRGSWKPEYRSGELAIIPYFKFGMTGPPSIENKAVEVLVLSKKVYTVKNTS